MLGRRYIYSPGQSISSPITRQEDNVVDFLGTIAGHHLAVPRLGDCQSKVWMPVIDVVINRVRNLGVSE